MEMIKSILYPVAVFFGGAIILLAIYSVFGAIGAGVEALIKEIRAFLGREE